MAKELGFEGLMMNSLAAVGDRKFVIETMQWASELMGDISRISEDLIIYGTAEFGFVRLADAYSTGSSLMPQKVKSRSRQPHRLLTRPRKTQIVWSSSAGKAAE